MQRLSHFWRKKSHSEHKRFLWGILSILALIILAGTLAALLLPSTPVQAVTGSSWQVAMWIAPPACVMQWASLGPRCAMTPEAGLATTI